jgi:glycosyltransferase involved in cell wall biosynthesis
MVAGLPVISTRVGGIPRIVEDGVTGLLVEPGDVNGFADALRTLLSQPETAHQMGMAGRLRAEREFGIQTILPQFEGYYLT